MTFSSPSAVTPFFLSRSLSGRSRDSGLASDFFIISARPEDIFSGVEREASIV